AWLIFASHATANWVGIIIVNLHFHTVWNSNAIGRKYLLLHLAGWGGPLVLTIIALATRAVMYQFATLCLVEQSKANLIFFYPLAAVVVPSFFIHMATFFHIAKISREDYKRKSGETSFSDIASHKRHVIQVLKIQWRALLLALLLLLTVIFYWIFYFFELGDLSRGPSRQDFLGEWLTCIQQDLGQDECSKIAAKYMPPFWLIIAAEMSTSLIGVELFCIFTNISLWKEWQQWVKETFIARRKIEFGLLCAIKVFTEVFIEVFTEIFTGVFIEE
ncbi:34072_t:CDS:2, partial [Racocetra persica]